MEPEDNGTLIKSEAKRAYFYRVLTAALPLLGLWGIVAENEIPLYLGLGAAILGGGLATANTTTKKES